VVDLGAARRVFHALDLRVDESLGGAASAAQAQRRQAIADRRVGKARDPIERLENVAIGVVTEAISRIAHGALRYWCNRQ